METNQGMKHYFETKQLLAHFSERFRAIFVVTPSLYGTGKKCFFLHELKTDLLAKVREEERRF